MNGSEYGASGMLVSVSTAPTGPYETYSTENFAEASEANAKSNKLQRGDIYDWQTGVGVWNGVGLL
jgi:hypothetical protein